VKYYGADVSSLVISNMKSKLNGIITGSSIEPTKELEVSNPSSHYEAIDTESWDIQLRRFYSEVAALELFVLDVVTGPVPPGIDLIFCRHMMIHLSTDENLSVIKNVQTSNARYFMATTYIDFGTVSATNKHSDNFEDFIQVMGRPINLMKPPYCLRSPLRFYRDEGFLAGQHTTSWYMGLWELRADTPLIREDCR